MTRECGACQLCCTLMSVESLGKPMNQRCEHQCADGCAIYARRPYACRLFDCLWLLGVGDEADRPDRVHAVLTMGPGGLVLHEEAGHQGEGRRHLIEVLTRLSRKFGTAPVRYYVGGEEERG